MHIRLATTRDLHRLAQITVTSLVDDPAFDYLWSNRHKFPEDHFFYWELQLKKWLYDPKLTFLVMVLEAENPPPSEKTAVISATIISFAIWQRLGHSATAKRRWAEKNTWQNLLDMSTARVEAWSISRKYQRRDADMQRLAAMRKASENDKHECFDGISEMWNLELLVTDRPFRRRGAATRLVKWGTAEANKEGVCCGVAASRMGARVYEVCGFTKLKTTVVHVQGQDESLSYYVMRRDACIPASPRVCNAGSDDNDVDSPKKVFSWSAGYIDTSEKLCV